ncbi:MAG: 23S rRNA (uracil(1939)-C(5))-methyltransferase RlmD [Bacteroidota bacterium]|nr:23S rRNA (uracil(1939)-C(5))-methyltransferase RlmD [Bacteroidota bacterium]MDP4230024.1 23S rRNA (uracil(1939)-C(5))-methyltransferase RlmD [Bacteroidota bacterium]MDP4234833.1 23S rRNA (uracil(1939)-C(5))-methyltransferase RlmD [Bacteroidota bacterium]
MTDNPEQNHARLPKPERGTQLELVTETFAFEGKAVARREDGYVIFVEGALANEKITVEIVKAKGNFADARLLKVLEPSADRRKPICVDFGVCGGCSLLHMNYDAQLFWKKQQVKEIFERIGKLHDPPILDTIGAPGHEYHYRNKMEFSFSEERWLLPEEIASGDVADRFALGLHVRGRYDRVIDTAFCHISYPLANRILELTRTFSGDHKLRVFDADKRPEGLLRFLVIRNSHSTGEVMVNFVTSHYDEHVMEAYARLLRKEIPEVTTLINNINSKRAQIAVGEKEYVIFGSGVISDKIGNAEYRISANSFFQTNTRQAEVLYKVGADFADLQTEDTLWDLYCGAGTITLFAAPRVTSVLGIELSESAIADAHANAERNGFSNVDFVSSDLRKALLSPDLLSKYGKPDVLIIDPPRSGMHADVVREILELAPERISYISCNPATQARDIELMSEKYSVEALQPVDMFPQTWHIECVAKLRRKELA